MMMMCAVLTMMVITMMMMVMVMSKTMMTPGQRDRAVCGKVKMGHPMVLIVLMMLMMMITIMMKGYDDVDDDDNKMLTWRERQCRVRQGQGGSPRDRAPTCRIRFAGSPRIRLL